MKGFIHHGLPGLCLGAGLMFSCGCNAYWNLVDPCSPQRYEYQARQETNAAMAPQVNNGRVLDQTVWNHHFEVGTDRLNAAGMEALSRMARRRPAPDEMIFLQTAQDIACDTSAPEKFITQRNALDERRRKTIEDYLKAITAGRNVRFMVEVHDPSDPTLPAVPLGGDGKTGTLTVGAVQKMFNTFQGGLAPAGGQATGGAPGGGGGGAGSR
jgi:hypothetical protein